MVSHEDMQPGMSLTQVMTILSSYWKVSALIALAVIVASVALAKILPKTYVAAATLMVNYDVNDPLAAKEFPVNMLGGYIQTQTELMQSPEVLDPVIERLNLTADPEYFSGNKGGDATLREWVEAKLLKNLEITPGRTGSQLIFITASADTAAKAADIANAVADIYSDQQYHSMNGPGSDRAKRFAQEIGDLKNKVAKAQDAVTQFRRRTGAIEGDARADVDMDVLTVLERKLADARSALDANHARAAGNREASAPVLASELVRNLRTEAATLKSALAKARTTLGPNHPQVVQLQSQIEANNASLSAALAGYSNAATSDVSISRTEVADLEQAVLNQRQKVLQARQYRDDGAKFQLELESAQAMYKRALDGYDQIMFPHFTNVNVASHARPPVKADKPNVILILILGIVLGIGLGIAGPFVYELRHRRVRCRDDLERDLGIPILIECDAIGPMAMAA